MRFLIVIALIYGAFHYVSKNFKFDDTLVWAHKNPGSKWADDVNYYVGLTYYQRADYPKSQEAFMQLLMDQATMSQHLGPALVRLEDSAEGNHDWETAKLSMDKYFDLREDYFPKDKNLDLMQKRQEGLKMRGHYK